MTLFLISYSMDKNIQIPQLGLISNCGPGIPRWPGLRRPSTADRMLSDGDSRSLILVPVVYYIRPTHYRFGHRGIKERNYI